jgi:hypothetical protein
MLLSGISWPGMSVLGLKIKPDERRAPDFINAVCNLEDFYDAVGQRLQPCYTQLMIEASRGIRISSLV